MYDKIKERKKGRGKMDYLKKPKANASPNDQGVNINVNM